MSLAVSSEFSDSQSIEFSSLFDPLQPYFEELDEFLVGQIDHFEPEIQEMVRYALGNSGKRLRSMLLFYSGWDGGSSPPQSMVRAAAVVELVHLATLVHDDILDDAEIRHQRPTVSQKYGASAAVLFGDALFAHALKLAADFPTNEVCRSVSLATRRVCAGEIKQNFHKGSSHLSLSQYFRIIELKTAELFWLSCHLGGYLADRESELIQSLETFGRHLGIAYQVFDDVTDLIGDESEIGKTLGTDLENGKFTLPVLLLFQNLDSQMRHALLARIREGASGVDKDIFTLFEERNILSRTMDFFHRELALSSRALKGEGHRSSMQKLLSINAYIESQMKKFQF